MKHLTVIATSALLSLSIVAPSYATTSQSAVAQNKIDINQAISVAKQHQAQGKLNSIEFNADDLEYEIEFASTSTKYETKISSHTGAVKSAKQKRIKNEDVARYKALHASKIDLMQAMQVAASHGQVIKAEFDIENNKPVYEVKTMKNGQEGEVVIDANTGQVINP